MAEAEFQNHDLCGVIATETFQAVDKAHKALHIRFGRRSRTWLVVRVMVSFGWLIL